MRKNKYVLLFILAGVFLLGGCRTSPVLNIDDAAISVGGNYTQTDVKKAIIRAGTSLGWQMKAEEPGRIQGTLNLRTHVAIIDILYDKSKYSIKYKDSKNLNYDGTNIHSNYNGWIERLNKNIQVQLSNM
jgi:hypothetical protein